MSLNSSLGEEETRSSDQLLELVRFLRREKEIAISRSEVQEAETQRLKTHLEQAERQLAEAQVIKLKSLLFLVNSIGINLEINCFIMFLSRRTCIKNESARQHPP